MRACFSFRVFTAACVLAVASALAAGCGSTAGSDAGGAGQSSAGSSAGGAAAGSSTAGEPSAGSGGNPSAGSGGGSASEVTLSCAAYASTRCARYQQCLPFSFGLKYGSLADCESSTEQSCPLEVAAPGTSRTAAALRACAAASMAQTCSEWLTSTPAACSAPGTNANGAACEYDSQCSTTYCHRAADGWCGKCEARTPVGGHCDPHEGACTDGSNCGHSCTEAGPCPKDEANWHCLSPKQENEACPFGSECRSDLYCVSGVCRKALALGEPCGDDVVLCAPELLCSSGANGRTCKMASYAVLGAACNVSEAQFCNASGTCSDGNGQAVSGAGTCKSAAAPGQPCASGCTAAAKCSAASICVLPVAASTCQ